MAKIIQPWEQDKIVGWVPDNPDPKDIALSIAGRSMADGLNPSDYPASVDTRQKIVKYDKLMPVEHQSIFNACVAFAAGHAFSFARLRLLQKDYKISKSYIYMKARQDCNLFPQDLGCTIRSAMRSMQKFGVPNYNLMNYTPDNINFQPEAKKLVKIDTDAAKHKALSYFRITSPREFIACLALGWPIVFGAFICKSFLRPIGGFIPMPYPPSDPYVGNHAMLCIGYGTNDLGKYTFIVKNSWGADWGAGGYCQIPEEYFFKDRNNLNRNLLGDCWTIQSAL